MKDNKVVWIFNHYAVTPDMSAGTRHYDFAKELAKRGYTATIFASSFLWGPRKELKLDKNEKHKVENLDGLNFVWVKTFPCQKNDWRRVVNMLSYTHRSYWLGRKIAMGGYGIEKPDVIIGSSVHLFAVYTAYLLSKRYKVPFIMEVRDLWPQTLIDMGVSKWHPFIILLSKLEKYLYKKADRIITVLGEADKYIDGLGIKVKGTAWVPNGVDLERFNINNRCINKQNSSDSSFTIIYAGAIGKANKLDVVIKAAEILCKDYADIQFLFVGDGQEKARLSQMVKEKNLNNVKFEEPVPRKEIGGVLKKADGLLFNLEDSPVFKYGISSNKLFDYLASGKPVIFSCNASNNPIEEAGSGITVTPDNPKELASSILKLYHMPEEQRKKMGERGREYVEKYHSIPVLVDKLEGVIDSVCKESKYANKQG